MATNNPPEYLLVGTIVRPHGVRGELAMRTLTDYPERLLSADVLYIGADYLPHQVKRVRKHSDGLLVHFESLADRNDAEHYRKEPVFIHIDEAIPLEDGEYYLYQVEGIRVVTDEGEELGHLTDYIETGANDVYIITAEDGQELLIPAIPDVILNVDLEAQVMTVHLLEGLR